MTGAKCPRRYSHIRIKAKHKAWEAIVSKPSEEGLVIRFNFGPKWRTVMSTESDWAERVRKLVSGYDEQTAGHQLIHRDNF